MKLIKIIVALLLFLVTFLSIRPSEVVAQSSFPGDANGDLKVDGMDYVIWLNHYGGNFTGVNNGDFNLDGKVDGQDYVIWLNHYGTVPSPTPTRIPTILPTPTLRPTSTPTPINQPTPGSTITFIDGYGGNVNTGKDAQISMGWPINNGGTHAHLAFERNQRSLIEFNLSSIPATAKLQEVTLLLYHAVAPEGRSPTPIYVYSISSGNQAWVEGTRNIALALSGENCWNALAANGSGGVQTAWAGSPGLSTPYIDYEGRHEPVNINNQDGAWITEGYIGNFMFDANLPIDHEYRVSLDVNRVKGWLGANNSNYGIVLRSVRNTGHVGSAENSTAGYRPKLVVRYTL